jgi:hypothetical protein
VPSPLVLVALDTIGEHSGKCFHQMCSAERLEHVPDCSRLDGATDEVATAVAGESHDRHIALVENLTGSLDAIKARQAEIDQDQVGSMLAGELNRFDSVASLGAYLIARVFKDQPQICANDWVIFNGENSGCRKCWHVRNLLLGTKKPQAVLPEANVDR